MTEPYPKYKASNIDWFGEVPERWKVGRIKDLFEIRKRISGELGYDILSITQSGIKIKDIDSNDGQLSMDYSKYQIVYPGDFAMNHMDLLTGWIDVSNQTGVTSPDYRVFAARNESSVCAKFFLYWFQQAYTCRLFYPFGQGSSQLGRWRLPTDAFYAFPVPVPTHSEQTSIAAFLVHETAKIDALVEEQRRLIELLKEKRQAVISHAVTKGLNPNAPMKDSGNEWLGEVPEHWTSIQVGKLCTKVSDGPHFSPKYVDEGVLFLSARNVKVDGWSLDDVKYISEEDCREFDRRIVPEVGDVLYTKGGTTGVARVVDLRERFQVWVHIAVLKIKIGVVDPYFLSYALNSIGCYEQSQLLTRGATNNDLGLTRMIKIWTVLPPLEQQRDIVQMLDIETRKMDTLISESENTVNLLQERRTALISAAVTGKIDVRNFTAKETEAA